MTRHYGRRAAARPAPTQHERAVAALVRAGVPAREAEGAYHRVIRATRRAGPGASVARLAQLVDLVARPLLARYAPRGPVQLVHATGAP